MSKRHKIKIDRISGLKYEKGSVIDIIKTYSGPNKSHFKNEYRNPKTKVDPITGFRYGKGGLDTAGASGTTPGNDCHTLSF